MLVNGLSIDKSELIELSDQELDAISGGFVCAGFCIAIAAGAAFAAGTAIGFAVTRAVVK